MRERERTDYVRQGTLATLRLAPCLGLIYEIRNRFMCQLIARCRVHFLCLSRIVQGPHEGLL
jgi:hypothetical protein